MIQRLFEEAQLRFADISECPGPDGLIAFDIHNKGETKFQIMGRSKSGKFTVNLSYAVNGWSNCAGIFNSLSYDQVLTFYDLISDQCVSVQEYRDNLLEIRE